MSLVLVYPDVASFKKREVAKRIKGLAEVFQAVSTLLGGLPEGQASTAQTLAILQRIVARLYPSTTEVALVANYPANRHPMVPVPINRSGLVQFSVHLQAFANGLTEIRASDEQLPPVEVLLSQADYDAMFSLDRKLAVSVPPQRYAHLAECDHPHNPLAFFLAATNRAGYRNIQCTVCPALSTAAAFVPNQQLSAQEKKEIFRSVLFYGCYFVGSSFEYIVSAFPAVLTNSFHRQVEDSPEEDEEEHQQHQTIVGQHDAGRLNDDCGFCLEPLGTHGRIAILSSCGHIFGESCLRGSLAKVTRDEGSCPICRASWCKAIILASTHVPEAKLAITDDNYREYMASRVPWARQTATLLSRLGPILRTVR